MGAGSPKNSLPGSGGELSVSQPTTCVGNETLTAQDKELVGLAAQLRDLATQNDPDAVRDGIAAIVDQLEKLAERNQNHGSDLQIAAA
jgi:hypothetical protein